MLNAVQTIDASILLFLQDRVRCGALTGVMKAACFLVDGGIVWITLALVLVHRKATRKEGIALGAALLAEVLINELLLKQLFARPRPFLTVEGLQLLIRAASSFSFPSGHTASSFAAAYVLTRVFGKKGAWAYLFAALVGFSRIYVGIHYPSDILCGALVGTLAAAAVWAVFAGLRNRGRIGKKS